MNLYLVRHGLANWPSWPGSDAERALTLAGERIIRAEGAALARLGLQPDLILHSPLVRARQTAELLAEALRVSVSDRVRAHELLSPGFDHKALKKLLREHSARDALMLVGHAPDMANVVERITGGAVKVKEGTVAHVQIEKPDEKPEGTLIWLATAELLVHG